MEVHVKVPLTAILWMLERSQSILSKWVVFFLFGVAVHNLYTIIGYKQTIETCFELVMMSEIFLKPLPTN